MDAAFVYRVYRGQSGLLVRKSGQVDPVDDGGVITIDIDKTCARGPGWLQRAAGGLTARLVRTSGL